MFNYHGLPGTKKIFLNENFTQEKFHKIFPSEGSSRNRCNYCRIESAGYLSPLSTTHPPLLPLHVGAVQRWGLGFLFPPLGPTPEGQVLQHGCPLSPSPF